MDKSDRQKQEAQSRIATFVDAYGLNPKVASYFEEGRIYYSYLTMGGFMGSIDTVAYDSRYAEAVARFESAFEGCLVYHAIETAALTGTTLALLYVGPDEDDWDIERPDDSRMFAYVANIDKPDFSEFGFVTVMGFGESGALVRIA